MNKKNTFKFCIICSVIMLVFASKSPAAVFKFMAAAPGGSWYPMASVMINIWQRNTDLKFTLLPGGGKSNTVATGEKKTELGVCYTTDATASYNGFPPYEKKYENIRVLMVLETQMWHAAVWKDSGMTTISDLRGKRVNVRGQGSSSEVLSNIIMGSAGIQFSEFSKVFHVGDAEGINLLKDGHMQAHLGGGGLPDGTFIEMSTYRPINFLAVPEAVQAKAIQKNPGLSPGVIPAGLYPGVDKDVPTLQYRLCIVVNAVMEDKTAYTLVKLFAENIAELYSAMESMKTLKPKDLAYPAGAPFHPGALKYYQEQGWAK